MGRGCRTGAGVRGNGPMALWGCGSPSCGLKPSLPWAGSKRHTNCQRIYCPRGYFTSGARRRHLRVDLQGSQHRVAGSVGPPGNVARDVLRHTKPHGYPLQCVSHHVSASSAFGARSEMHVLPGQCLLHAKCSGGAYGSWGLSAAGPTPVVFQHHNPAPAAKG